MRCRRCLVGWDDRNAPCWNCGDVGEMGTLERLGVLLPRLGTQIRSTSYRGLPVYQSA